MRPRGLCEHRANAQIPGRDGVPARLGTPFRWLLGSSWISNLGDGIILAAGPLLVASETREPLLVALAWTLQYLPTMLFGLFAGVVADRVERRRLIVVANAGPGGVLLVLFTTVATGQVNIAVVLASIFLLGTAETFADTDHGDPAADAGRQARPRHRQRAADGAGIVTLNQLVGPPVGAAAVRAGPLLPVRRPGGLRRP